MINVFPKDVRTIQHDVRILAHCVWVNIRETIDDHEIFGLAIDAGIDSVLHEHVLVAVIYVGSHRWLTPPMYHPKFGAFNGKDTAEILVSELQRCLQRTRIAKLAYLVADGCAVNHIARKEAHDALRQAFESITPLGDSDWNAFYASFIMTQPQIVLLPCVGHLLNNIAKDKLRVTICGNIAVIFVRPELRFMVFLLRI